MEICGWWRIFEPQPHPQASSNCGTHEHEPFTVQEFFSRLLRAEVLLQALRED
jgi:hypothetical protein